jgi:hypothetical protein
MLLCCLLYPICVYQVPLDGSALGQRWVSARSALLASPRALASSRDDQCSPHPGPILLEPLSHRSLDILVSKCVLHCGLLHARFHAGAPPENRLLTLLPSSSDDGEEKKRCSPVFEFSLPPCALTRRVCTLSVCVPHCAVWPRCCLLWLALFGASTPGLLISRPPHHHPQHAPPAFPAHTPQPTLPLPSRRRQPASMEGIDAVAASARYVVVIVWRPSSSPFPSAIARGHPPAPLLASLLLSDAPRLPVGLMRCPCYGCPLPCRPLPSFGQVAAGPVYHHEPPPHH